MNRLIPFCAKKPFFLLTGSLLLALVFVACNDEGTLSPYDEILTSPSFASLTDSIKQQPRNDELYFRRAVLLNKKKFPEPALADFKKAWSLNKQETYALGMVSVWLDKRPDSAAAFLNEAITELPGSLVLRFSLAHAYDALDKTDAALATCDTLLRIQPDQPEVLLFQADLLIKKGNRPEAISSLEKAHRLLPGNFELGLKLAYQYAESKDQRAIALCDTLIGMNSAKLYAEPYYIKGTYYSNINSPTKAIRLFDQTIQHDYNHLNAYIDKGKILVDQKKYDDAYEVFALVNRIKPAFPDAYYWMGVCQEARGKKEDAKLNYEKAYGLDKTFIEAKEAADKLSK